MTVRPFDRLTAGRLTAGKVKRSKGKKVKRHPPSLALLRGTEAQGLIRDNNNLELRKSGIKTSFDYSQKKDVRRQIKPQ